MTQSCQPLAVSEALGWLSRTREKELVHWWLRRAERAAELCCISGERLLVLNAGELNDGPGPDILNCHLILDDVELTGAVEMHVESRDWYFHGHHKNPAYEQVVLHVVARDGKGPDLPTLLVNPVHRPIDTCLAGRTSTQAEIWHHASMRFHSKLFHTHQLGMNAKAYHAGMLGMMEVILAGPQRDSLLPEVASMLGLTVWPHQRKWMGSRQSYRPVGEKQKILINRLVEHQDILLNLMGQMESIRTWLDFDRIVMPLINLGISQNHCREWMVNIIAPSLGEKCGLDMWQKLNPFRSYGHEKQCSTNLGMARINSILEQQGVLEWWNQRCKYGNCSACPLIRSHHTLTGIN